LEGNSFAELMMRNTNVHTLKADAFATADCKFELKNLAGTPAGFAQFGNTVNDDPNTECEEQKVLIRMPDGTIQYRARNLVDPSGINAQSVYNGTGGVDRMFGGNDNDTFWGGLGNDVIEGGAGADVALGGFGDDIITDTAGDDVPKGGPGNDAIDAGIGLDILMGGDGKDFTNGGANANETFGGDDDDFIMLGESLDAAFGDSGDDYEEGGNQPDLMQGDSGNLFFLDDSQKPGSDILVGQGGDDDYDMEGGDDIGVGGPGIEKVAGASGYDWEIGIGDPQRQDMDLDLPLPALDILTVGVRDRFNEVESLSGGDLNDILRGDDVVPAEVGGGGFIGCDVLDQAGLDRIHGLDALVPELTTPLADVSSLSASQECPLLDGPVWGAGNILLGGPGSDLIEGRGADDIIDGDKYLNVRLSVRNAAGDEIGSTTVNKTGQSPMTQQYLRDANGALTGPTLQQAVFAGTVNPGNIVAVREIVSKTAAPDCGVAGGVNCDTAVFSGPRSNYTLRSVGDHLEVSQTGADVVGQKASDGVDTLRNVERLRFSDTILTVQTPAAPTNLQAKVANRSAALTWSTPVPNGESYTLVVKQGATTVSTTRNIGRTAVSRNVTGLVPGEKYTFELTSVNQFGSGPAAVSNEITAAAPPAAPSGVVATRGNRSASLSWTPGSDNSSAITRYVVQIRTGLTVVGTRTIDGAVSEAEITGLTNGVSYNFRVQAVNGAGSSLFAGSNAVVPATVPDAPRILAPTQGAAGGYLTAVANWDAPLDNGGSVITHYRVIARRMAADGVTPTGTETVSIVTAAFRSRSFTLPAGNYRFEVIAINSTGNSVPSDRSEVISPR
ncbi:MAG: fibronectin type III domain-containing protein, partial [Nocardioidaceae bacterium]